MRRRRTDAQAAVCGSPYAAELGDGAQRDDMARPEEALPQEEDGGRPAGQ